MYRSSDTYSFSANFSIGTVNGILVFELRISYDEKNGFQGLIPGMVRFKLSCTATVTVESHEIPNKEVSF